MHIHFVHVHMQSAGTAKINPHLRSVLPNSIPSSPHCLAKGKPCLVSSGCFSVRSQRVNQTDSSHRGRGQGVLLAIGIPHSEAVLLAIGIPPSEAVLRVLLAIGIPPSAPCVLQGIFHTPPFSTKLGRRAKQRRDFQEYSLC